VSPRDALRILATGGSRELPSAIFSGGALLVIHLPDVLQV
jgi:hypothetical protein